MNFLGQTRISIKVWKAHRLNIELDLQSLFGLHVHSCTHWLRPRNPPPPAFGLYTRALLVSQDRRHLFVIPWKSRIRIILESAVSILYTVTSSSARRCITRRVSLLTGSRVRSWIKHIGLDTLTIHPARKPIHSKNKHNILTHGISKAALKYFKKIFLAGLSVLATHLLMSSILYFWEMSGFEPRELPYQAGALPA